jgi:DNA-dependent RNA polymerase auxiliary subunit epsilon
VNGAADPRIAKRDERREASDGEGIEVEQLRQIRRAPDVQTQNFYQLHFLQQHSDQNLNFQKNYSHW